MASTDLESSFSPQRARRLVGHFIPEGEKDRLAPVENGRTDRQTCIAPLLHLSERYITASGEIWSKMPEKWTISAIELIGQQHHSQPETELHNDNVQRAPTIANGSMHVPMSQIRHRKLRRYHQTRNLRLTSICSFSKSLTVGAVTANVHRVFLLMN